MFGDYYEQDIILIQYMNKAASEQQNEYFIQNHHFEWEKQYIKHFQCLILNNIKYNECLDKAAELFKNTIKTQSQEDQQNAEKFIQYILKYRKEAIVFGDEEIKNIENNLEFQYLIIHFHKCVGILIEIEFKNMKEQDLIDYFQSLDFNIKGFLYCLLDDLLKITIWKEKIVMLKNFQNNNDNIHSLQLGEKVYQKQQIIQQQQNKNKYFTILIIGAIGTGKSRLAQELLQELQGNQIDKQFIEGSRIEGVTKDLNRIQFKYGNIAIDLIDTPGCGDMETGLKLVFEQLTDKSEEINLILFCMNAQILRLHREDICFLSILQGIFKCNWEIFFICLNFMEQVNKEQLKSDNIVNSFEKRLEIKLPQQNVIIENDTKIKIQRIKQIIEEFIEGQNQNKFKLRYLPDLLFIYKRLKQYKV